MLGKQARREDIVGRYGGDEFGLILAECPIEDGMEVAGRIRSELAAMPVPGGANVRLTVSIGVASLSPQIATSLDWLGRADKALYQAKESGRNCVRVYEDAGFDEVAAH